MTINLNPATHNTRATTPLTRPTEQDQSSEKAMSRVKAITLCAIATLVGLCICGILEWIALAQIAVGVFMIIGFISFGYEPSRNT